MRVHELIRRLDAEKVREILTWFREQERDVYRVTLSSLASQRNLRPVYVQRKTAAEQMAWMHKTLCLPAGAEVGEQLIQTWLMKARPEMLKQFLDRVGVEHDGEGAVDDLPDSLDADNVHAAVAGLLESFSSQDVAIYLHMFQRQSPGGWPALQQAIERDPRLSLTTPVDAQE